MNAKRPSDLDTIAEFARWHVASGDIDPVYPVIRWLIDEWRLDTETALRFVLLYVAYYDLASAVSVWLADGWRPGERLDERFWKYPTGTERRAHRTPRKLVDHLDAVDARGTGGNLSGWLLGGLPADRSDAWRIVQERLRSVYGNGRWAAYKTGEILSTVLGAPLAPTDAGHDFSTGPRHGLALIYPATATLTGASPAVVAALGEATERLRSELADRGVELPVEQVETVLCDWHSVAAGRYYVGHDIDLMDEQLRRVHVDAATRDLVYRARLDVFDPRWLGEAGGWEGVRKPLRRLWVDEGRVTWW